MGTLERRERERRQREEQILDAAEAVFFNKGFDNSTMDDVAEKSELSKGALYNYFKSKNELCIGIVSRSLHIVTRQLEEIPGTEVSGLKQLQTAGDVFIDFFKKHPKYYCALQNYKHHRSGCGTGSRTLKTAIKENERINNIFISIIKKGIEDNSIREGIPPDKTAKALWGDLNGIIPACILDIDNKGSTEIFSHAIDLIINGLVKK